MNLLHGIKPRSKNGDYNMIVENPSGVSTKYEVNKEYGIIGLDRFLHIPMAFPFEYGFIPQSWNKSDDDPIDIMALMSGSTFVGCLLQVRIVGMYKLIDTGEIDNKVLAVCSHDKMFNEVETIEDLPGYYLKEIEFFWQNYKNLTPGKETEGRGWADRTDAVKFVDKAIKNYQVKFPNEE
jgi:inorganic pyrophosphatase